MSNCTNCNNPIPEGNSFCQKCGTPVAKSQAAQPAPAPAPAPVYQQHTPVYSAPVAQPQQLKSVSCAGWFLRSILMAIPICNIIMLFVWAGNKKAERSARTWAKLQLIYFFIGIGLCVVGVVIALIMGLSFSDALELSWLKNL